MIKCAIETSFKSANQLCQLAKSTATLYTRHFPTDSMNGKRKTTTSSTQTLKKPIDAMNRFLFPIGDTIASFFIPLLIDTWSLFLNEQQNIIVQMNAHFLKYSKLVNFDNHYQAWISTKTFCRQDKNNIIVTFTTWSTDLSQ